MTTRMKDFERSFNSMQKLFYICFVTVLSFIALSIVGTFLAVFMYGPEVIDIVRSLVEKL